MKFNPLTRRAFLQGAGGYALAIPFLGSLLSEKALAASAPPSRFVFMGSYFGRDIDYWYPKMDPTLISPDGKVRYTKLTDIAGNISPILADKFTPLKNKISVLRGLDVLQNDGGHSQSAALTASGTFSGTPSFGYSIDAILEESARFTPTSLPLGALRTYAHNAFKYSQSPASFTSRSGITQPLGSQWSPQIVFDNYFNPATAQARSAASSRKHAVTNAVMADLKSTMNSRAIASSDKARLDNFMTLMVSLETRLGNMASCSRFSALSLGTTSDTLQSAMIDMEVAALACGMTNIVIHGIEQYDASFTPADNTYHSYAHGNGAIPSTTDAGISMHATCNKWQMGKVAEMLTKLDAVPDINGTLLDNTFFLSGDSDSRGFHQMYDMPVLVAGGQGKLKTGYFMDFRPRPLNVIDSGLSLIAGVPYNNLLITLLKGMGLTEADYQKFGQAGFGSYTGFDPKLASWYAPYIAQPNATLPFLYTG